MTQGHRQPYGTLSRQNQRQSSSAPEARKQNRQPLHCNTMWAVWAVMPMALGLLQAQQGSQVHSGRVTLVSCCAANPCRIIPAFVVCVKTAIQAECRRAAATPTRMPPRCPRTPHCCNWEVRGPAPFCLLLLLLVLRGGSVLAGPSSSAPMSCQEAASYSVPRLPWPLMGTAGSAGCPQPTQMRR